MSVSDTSYIYIDQNIIQYAYEGTLTIETCDDVCFVYSNEHFNELSRYEDERFFDILRRIKARKLVLNLDNYFDNIDDAIILDYQDPKILYERYQETIKGNNNPTNIFLSLQPYFMGNINTIEPQSINSEFVNSLKGIIDNPSMSEFFPQGFQETYNEIIEDIGENLEKQLSNSKDEILPLERQRKQITKKDLSDLNVEDGLIIDQIWSLVKDKFTYVDKDQLFGKKPLPFLPTKKMAPFFSAVQCHTMLNALGYWPDKGLTKLSKVYGINSDASHIGHSLFCSGIMSADKRLCKKADAIFQYLNLNNPIFEVKINVS